MNLEADLDFFYNPLNILSYISIFRIRYEKSATSASSLVNKCPTNA